MEIDAFHDDDDDAHQYTEAPYSGPKHRPRVVALAIAVALTIGRVMTGDGKNRTTKLC
jgi:hypothetical protein